MTVHQIIDKEEVNGCAIEYGIDSGLGAGETRFVTVSDDDWRVVRTFKFDEFSRSYARNFGKKVATDPEYRQACLDGTTAWAQIGDIYREFDQRLLDIYRDAGLLGYNTQNGTEKERFDEAQQHREQFCREAFEYVDEQIRDGETVDSTVLDELAEKAQTVATRLSLQTSPDFHVGDRVKDLDQSDPDPAVIVANPDTTIDEHYVGEGQTVADFNTDYPNSAGVVEIVFLPDIHNQLQASEQPDSLDDLSTDRLQDIAAAESVTTYSYPSPRLSLLEDANT